jgi:hypothetical protein
MLALAELYSITTNGRLITESERILERNSRDLPELISQNLPGGPKENYRKLSQVSSGPAVIQI